MNEREKIEALEACQPESRYRSASPELAAAIERDPLLGHRFQKMVQWDHSIREALSDTPVPAGLADRVLAVLAERQRAAETDASDAVLNIPSEPLPIQEPVAVPLARPTRRRRLAVAGAVLVSAALVLVAVFSQQRPAPTPQPGPELANEVIHWAGVAANGSWQSDFSAPELRRYPFADAIRAVPRRWAQLPTRYHRETVVYDLTPPGARPIYVFCFPAGRTSANLASAPPARPFSTTGGYAVGVWQGERVIYALAVQGDERRYRALIQSPVLLGRSGDAARAPRNAPSSPRIRDEENRTAAERCA